MRISFFKFSQNFLSQAWLRTIFSYTNIIKWFTDQSKLSVSFCKLCMCRCSWSGCYLSWWFTCYLAALSINSVFFICFISGSSSNTVTQIYRTMRSTNQFVQWENFHFHMVLVCYAMHCDSGKRVKMDLEPCLLASPDQVHQTSAA